MAKWELASDHRTFAIGKNRIEIVTFLVETFDIDTQCHNVFDGRDL
jgi:hypothetical protein